MDIRLFGRFAVVALVIMALTIWTLAPFLHAHVGNTPVYLLVLAAFVSAILYRGWGRVRVAAMQGANRVAPHVQASANALAHTTRDNIAATAAIICLILCIGFAFAGKTEAAVLTFYAVVVFAIAHFKGDAHFFENWKGYWLAISIVGALHSFAFGHGWKMVVAYVVSAILAAISSFEGWDTTFASAGKGFHNLTTFLGKLLFEGYGRSVLCVGWTVVSVLIAVLIPSLMIPAMVAATGFFIGAVMLGVNTLIPKP